MLNQTVFKKISSVALALATLTISFAANPALISSATAATGPSLVLTDTVDKAIADRGETLSYTITAKNAGDVDLTNVLLWINQPNLADYVPGSSTAQGVPGGQTVKLDDNWITTHTNLGKIPVGKSVVVKYQTKVAQNANPKDIIWSVAASNSEQTNKVQAQASTEMVFRSTALCAAKTADKTSVSVGDVVTFNIKICNQSNINLTDIIVVDKINAPFKYVPGSTVLDINGKSIAIDDNWINSHVNIGNLPAGMEANLKYKVTIMDGLVDGQTLKNVAILSANETSGAIACEVVLKGKVLGVVTPPVTPPTTPTKPAELPNTGPGEVMLLVSSLVPAGWALKKFKSKI
ncbi:MAG TPA: DUF11 domain-containing protein [Candidatus Saccharimonadales bacterium]|nr:DUF11 domain-containing protein [Candidatus Saccharimonadales bacterium]